LNCPTTALREDMCYAGAPPHTPLNLSVMKTITTCASNKWFVDKNKWIIESIR